MQIIAARQYVSPRTRPLSPDEAETRRLSYAIKSKDASGRDVATAALEMARLITGPCWLIPIPDRNGNADANARLAHHIAMFTGNGAQVVRAIIRTSPIQSQCERHKHAQGPIRPEDHHLARTNKMLNLRQAYFVDNVTTSGNTLFAAFRALGFGAGLVFADASNRRTQYQSTMF